MLFQISGKIKFSYLLLFGKSAMSRYAFELEGGSLGDALLTHPPAIHQKKITKKMKLCAVRNIPPPLTVLLESLGRRGVRVSARNCCRISCR